MSSFFGKLSQQFEQINEDGSINTQIFIDATKQILQFFEFLGTGFAKAQSRISGPLNLLEKKYSSDKEKFVILQNIVNDEIKENSSKTKTSGTMAILLLKRALTFIRVFLQELLKGEKDLLIVGKTAYEHSLKPYHGWMIQKMFGLAIKGIPYRENLMKALGPDCTEDYVLAEMKQTVETMAANIDTLNAFYKETGQESTDQI